MIIAKAINDVALFSFHNLSRGSLILVAMRLELALALAAISI